MRKVIVMMSLSVDGFFEGPHREIDWGRVDEELHQHFSDQLATAGAFLSGRVTYELVASFWPTADQDATGSPAVVQFAGMWRDMPKLVYSTTLGVARTHP